MSDNVENVVVGVPESTTIAVLQSTQEAVKAQEAEERKAAEKVRHAATACYRKAENVSCKLLIKSGELGWEYCCRRIRLKDTWKSACVTLAGDWSAVSGKAVKPEYVIRAAMAAKLLRAEGDDVPYTHFRDAYSQLVECDWDTLTWHIIPLIADDAAACYRASTDAKLSFDGTRAAVTVVQQKLARLQREAKEDAARKVREEEMAAKAAHLAARVETDKAEEIVKAASNSLDPAAANVAMQELLAKQREEAAKAADMQAKERERVKADADAKRAADIEARALQTARDKADAKQARETQREAKATAGPIASLQTGVNVPVGKMDIANAAAMLWTFTTEQDDPEGTFEAYVDIVKASGTMSASMMRAIAAFRASLDADHAKRAEQAAEIESRRKAS